MFPGLKWHFTDKPLMRTLPKLVFDSVASLPWSPRCTGKVDLDIPAESAILAKFPGISLIHIPSAKT
jgi:hypothetical protein